MNYGFANYKNAENDKIKIQLSFDPLHPNNLVKACLVQDDYFSQKFIVAATTEKLEFRTMISYARYVAFEPPP